MLVTCHGNITEINVISIYQISEKQFSRVFIGSLNLEYHWQFTVLLFISSLLYHSYLLPYLHIFIYSFLFLHFALEFALDFYRRSPKKDMVNTTNVHASLDKDPFSNHALGHEIR